MLEARTFQISSGTGRACEFIAMRKCNYKRWLILIRTFIVVNLQYGESPLGFLVAPSPVLDAPWHSIGTPQFAVFHFEPPLPVAAAFLAILISSSNILSILLP
jgi:hypothetical protein